MNGLPSPPPSARNLRRQLHVLRREQGELLFRVMLYCMAATCATYSTCVLGKDLITRVFETIYGGEVPAVLPAAMGLLLALAVIAPWVLLDAVRMSNRMVAPFVRAHARIRRLGIDDDIAPIETRDDEWKDWIHDFNVMLSRIREQRGSGSEVS